MVGTIKTYHLFTPNDMFHSPCLNHIFQHTLYTRLIQSILPMQNIRLSICSVERPIRLWDHIHIINFATNDMFPMLSALSLALVVMYYTPANFSELEAQRVCTLRRSSNVHTLAH